MHTIHTSAPQRWNCKCTICWPLRKLSAYHIINCNIPHLNCHIDRYPCGGDVAVYNIYYIYYISPISYRVIVRCPCKTHSPAALWSPDTQVWRENWVWLEYDTRTTPKCILACTRGMTPEWHQRHQDDTHASPPTPPEAKAWDHWIAKVPQEAQQTNQPQKRALAVKWRLRTHSWISLQKTFLIKSAKLFPNNFQNKSVFYLTKSSDGQKIACAAH